MQVYGGNAFDIYSLLLASKTVLITVPLSYLCAFRIGTYTLLSPPFLFIPQPLNLLFASTSCDDWLS